MTKRNNCSICSYFQKYPYKISEKLFFEKKVRENLSLRKLSLVLEVNGLKASKDMVARHKRECMGIKTQRKGLELVGKLRDLIKPEGPLEIKQCQHIATKSFYDITSERVFTKCLQCGEILDKIGADPEGKNSKRKDRAFWRSLRK